jgi:predicted peptidase
MIRALLWLLPAAGLCLIVSPAGAQGGTQQAQQATAEAEVPLNFLLYLPQDYNAQDKWPLLLFLHGAGERGSDLEKVKVHGPPKLIAAGRQFPMIVVSPQCPAFRR